MSHSLFDDRTLHTGRGIGEVFPSYFYCLYPVLFPRILRRWILSGKLFLLQTGLRDPLGVRLWDEDRARTEGWE